MAIISTIGRRCLKVRLLIGTIYTLLIIGAVTMIYPFMLMIAGSTKSNVDSSDSKMIPSFLIDDTALYRKHVEGFFNESLSSMRIAHNVDFSSFRVAEPPVQPNRAFADAWSDYVGATDLPLYTYGLSYVRAHATRGVFPSVLRTFKSELIQEFDNNIEQMNKAMGRNFLDWAYFYLYPEDYLRRLSTVPTDGMADRLGRFKAEQPITVRVYFSVENYYRNVYLKTQYPGPISTYNETHDTHYATWDDVHLDRHLPDGKGRTDLEREDWTIFTRSIVNMLWVRAEPQAIQPYRTFLQAKYGTIDALNRNYQSSYTAFSDIALVGDISVQSGLASSDWEAFVQGWKDPVKGTMHILPARMIRVHSLDFMFREHLRSMYGSIDAANRALGTSFKSWLDALPPQHDLFAIDFEGRKKELRKEFVVRNYLSVLDYIVLHGRGILNTAIYCALAILGALTVNPLAAYALSRYKPPSTYKILLLLMLTMAFPPMVTQIPMFLMLRELGLLNTFAALILPTMANGYSIFLLKGFFDSLPQELYESAEIDGAGEFRIFWQITMSLSTPILAVIALRAFTVAYSNFMMALLICQDDKMWTLMPWLYQLQQRSGPGVIFASLIVAAVPTFIVFVLCQNVIMRGIVVPVEK